MTPEEKLQFNNLKRDVEALKSSATIPFDVDQAFRTRFRLSTFSSIRTSSKSATSENQAVNEAGMAVYSVLGIPDAYIQTTLNGTTYHIPVFTS